MGNMHCEPRDAAHLASVARGICPFPNYTPNPLFVNMLTPNSSLHLRHHYRTVQSSLIPEQLEGFTQGLRTTFGREGKVAFGGVGIVALSLAVLFDALARQSRGEREPDSGAIPGLFLKDLRGFYPQHVYTLSEYLRLVPHIANNPTRMRNETDRYIKQMEINLHALDRLMGENNTLPIKEDITAINIMLGQFFLQEMLHHSNRINSSGVLSFQGEASAWLKPAFGGEVPAEVIFNLNCDPEVADKEFLAEVNASENRTKEAFKSCKSGIQAVPKSWLLFVAQLEWLDAMFSTAVIGGNTGFDNRREDFDLKADALGKW